MKHLVSAAVILLAWWVLAARRQRSAREGAGVRPRLSLDLAGDDLAPDGTPAEHYAG